MASCPITSWQIDGETIEKVTDFIFWKPEREEGLSEVIQQMSSRSKTRSQKAQVAWAMVIYSWQDPWYNCGAHHHLLFHFLLDTQLDQGPPPPTPLPPASVEARGGTHHLPWSVPSPSLACQLEDASVNLNPPDSEVTGHKHHGLPLGGETPNWQPPQQIL